MVETFEFTVNTKGFTDIINISDKIFTFLDKSKINNGIALVHTPGSTVAITTTEFEPGTQKDLKSFFQKIIPEQAYYYHNETWHDGNGYAHLRASLLKSNFSFPIINKKPILGTWQQIILIDFDNTSRTRKIYLQIVGD